MIITLKGANFANSNIGTLSTWRISTTIGEGATYSGPTSVNRDPAEELIASITIADGYELGAAGVTVTMGGVGQTFTQVGNTITVYIVAVTGNVEIKVPTTKIVTEEPDVPGGDVTEPETPVTYAFPLRANGLGVASTGTGKVSINAATRISNASDTEQLGILVPAGKTITLNGLTSGEFPLRFDYVYGTQNVANPTNGNLEGLVGTASNYLADAYFPFNIDGADSCSVTNASEQDYYYWFCFAGLTKSEQVGAKVNSYTITYTISSSDISWTELPVNPVALGVSSTGTGRVSDNAARFSTADDSKANGILIPAGQTIHLKGLASGTHPLRFDYMYGTQNVPNPASGSTTAIEGLGGTASNYDSNSYFPINTSGNDTCSVTNVYGQDYYFWFVFAGLNKSEAIKAEIGTYDIKYYIV